MHPHSHIRFEAHDAAFASVATLAGVFTGDRLEAALVGLCLSIIGSLAVKFFEPLVVRLQRRLGLRD